MNKEEYLNEKGYFSAHKYLMKKNFFIPTKIEGLAMLLEIPFLSAPLAITSHKVSGDNNIFTNQPGNAK